MYIIACCFSYPSPIFVETAFHAHENEGSVLYKNKYKYIKYQNTCILIKTTHSYMEVTVIPSSKRNLKNLKLYMNRYFAIKFLIF